MTPQFSSYQDPYLVVVLVGSTYAVTALSFGAVAALGRTSAGRGTLGGLGTAALAIIIQTAFQISGTMLTKTTVGNGFLSNGNAKQGHKKEEKGQCSSLHHGSFLFLLGCR